MGCIALVGGILSIYSTAKAPGGWTDSHIVTMCAATFALLSSAGGLLTISYFAYCHHCHYINYQTTSQKFIAVVVQQDEKDNQPSKQDSKGKQPEIKKTGSNNQQKTQKQIKVAHRSGRKGDGCSRRSPFSLKKISLAPFSKLQIFFFCHVFLFYRMCDVNRSCHACATLSQLYNNNNKKKNKKSVILLSNKKVVCGFCKYK